MYALTVSAHHLQHIILKMNYCNVARSADLFLMAMLYNSVCFMIKNFGSPYNAGMHAAQVLLTKIFIGLNVIRM